MATRTIVDGDTLWDILDDHYGFVTADLVWAISEYNDFDNPSDIPIGTVVLLPPLAPDGTIAVPLSPQPPIAIPGEAPAPQPVPAPENRAASTDITGTRRVRHPPSRHTGTGARTHDCGDHHNVPDVDTARTDEHDSSHPEHAAVPGVASRRHEPCRLGRRDTS